MSNMPEDWDFEEYKDVATLQWIDGWVIIYCRLDICLFDSQV